MSNNEIENFDNEDFGSKRASRGAKNVIAWAEKPRLSRLSLGVLPTAFKNKIALKKSKTTRPKEITVAEHKGKFIKKAMLILANFN